MDSDKTKEHINDLKVEIRADTHNSCRRHSGRAKFHVELTEYAFGRLHGPGELGCIYAGLIENLYIAAELLLETELILLGIPYKDTHNGIREAYRTKFVQSGMCTKEFWDAFNKLDGLRQKARYLKATLLITEADSKELIDVIKKQVTYLQEHYGTKLW